MRGVFTAEGTPQARAADEDGAVANSARADKERTYPELVASRRCKLVVVCVETGGRFSDEAVSFLRALAEARARDSTPMLRRGAERQWLNRWSRVLGIACATAYATSLVAPSSRAAALAAPVADGCRPCLEELFGEGGAGVGEGLVAAHTALCGGAQAPASRGLGAVACGGSSCHGSVGVGAAAATAS